MKVYVMLGEVSGKSDPWISVADIVWLDREEAIECFKEQVQQAKDSFAKENNISWEEEGWEIDESDTLFDAYHEARNIWMKLTLLERETAGPSGPPDQTHKRCCSNCMKELGCELLLKTMTGSTLQEEYERVGSFVCDDFTMRWIEYPIAVTEIKHTPLAGRRAYREKEIGSYVKIRPCAAEYATNTYLGLYLGELPVSTGCSHNSETGVLEVSAKYNPAIYVFSLKKIIYGMESFWGIIDSPEQVKEITDKDIDSLPYVKVLREGLVC